MGRHRRQAEIDQEDVMRQVKEVLEFSGFQGATTLLERLEDDEFGRRRIRVRVPRGEGNRDFVYDVLIDKDGLMGIYRTV